MAHVDEADLPGSLVVEFLSSLVGIGQGSCRTVTNDAQGIESGNFRGVHICNSFLQSRICRNREHKVLRDPPFFLEGIVDLGEKECHHLLRSDKLVLLPVDLQIKQDRVVFRVHLYLIINMPLLNLKLLLAVASQAQEPVEVLKGVLGVSLPLMLGSETDDSLLIRVCHD